MAKSEEKSEEKAGGKRKAEPDKKSGDSGDTVRKVRSLVATAVWVLAVIAAVILAIGALVVALDFNEKNGVVTFFRETAENVNILGTLKEFSGKNAAVKEALVNWGICAVIYLVLGKVLERVIRP